ncbi:hypothetical protein PAXRUDRAFT_775724 [Paxillus rubicundulus Ve08.2h10]|uniref:Uncharacterized protein n=1 Tax=Paxillus rubicundulus Ve08.2h10 TaxID=930991 RepID=A0A0D0C3Y8_9AGAM|nr:hypothetical protein PAXRUDRAFT_775724 [Paxillus rubicundulus Ve08.2h10]
MWTRGIKVRGRQGRCCCLFVLFPRQMPSVILAVHWHTDGKRGEYVVMFLNRQQGDSYRAITHPCYPFKIIITRIIAENVTPSRPFSRSATWQMVFSNSMR